MEPAFLEDFLNLHEFESAPSSLDDDKDRRSVFDNLSYLAPKSRKELPAIHLPIVQLFDIDSSSVGMRTVLEMPIETYLKSKTFEDFVSEGIVELDVDVRMPPIKQWTATIRIKKVERKGPSVVTLDLYEQ